jgi:hypothetical protein
VRGKRAVFQYIPGVKVHLISELLRVGYTETEKIILARNIPAQAKVRFKHVATLRQRLRLRTTHQSRRLSGQGQAHVRSSELVQLARQSLSGGRLAGGEGFSNAWPMPRCGQ